MPRLNVGFITPALYWGGAERWMLDLARWSRSRLHWTGCASVFPMHDDDTMVGHFARLMPVHVARRLGHRRAVAKVAAQADCLICWGAYPLRELVGDFAGPIVFVSHGSGRFDREAAAFAVSGATHYAAVARAAMPPLLAAGVPRDKITVLHNGIDPGRVHAFRPRSAVRRELGAEGRCLVGFIGRMVPEKNPVAVAEAVARLPDRYRAVFVGGGWDLDAQRAAVREVLGPRAIFIDRTEAVGDYYAALDVFALGSEREGFSMGMLEAMWHRIPCALTNVGVLPELERAHGRHWEVIAPGGAQDRDRVAGELAAAIRRIDVLLGGAIRQKRTAAARALVGERFLAANMADRWVDYVRRIVLEWRDDRKKTRPVDT